MIRFLIFSLIILFIPGFVLADLPLGEIPPAITLEGDVGGRVDGTAWSSSELKGRLFTVIYADPDEASLNDHAVDAMKKLKLPKEKTGSYAIINMDATWKPNSIISSVLKSKQAENPTTIFVKDMDKLLVDKWKLKDDSSNIIIVAPDGKVVFCKGGKLSEADVKELTDAMQANVN